MKSQTGKSQKPQKPAYVPAFDDKVMTRNKDDLRVGIVQRAGETKSQIKWRKGTQTVCNASLVRYTPELLQERLEAVRAAKEASRYVCSYHPDRTQAEAFASQLSGVKTDVRDLRGVNKTATPFQVRIYAEVDALPAEVREVVR